MKILASLFLSVFAFFSLAAGPQDHVVNFKLLPEKPIVLESNLTIDKGTVSERVILGPWFGFNYLLENDTDEALIVATLEVRFTADYNDNSGKSTQVYYTDPGLYMDIYDVDKDGVTTEPRSVMARVEARTDFIDEALTHVSAQYFKLYQDREFELEVVAVGWFVDENDVPTKRFRKVFRGITQ